MRKIDEKYPTASQIGDIALGSAHSETILSSRFNDLRMSQGVGVFPAASIKTHMGRLRTFFLAGENRWTRQEKELTPDILAASGLVFNPGYDVNDIERVTCAYCGTHFSKWNGVADANALHAAQSPRCPFINNAVKEEEASSVTLTPRVYRIGNKWMIEHYKVR